MDDKQILVTNPPAFVTSLNKDSDRLDCAWFNPVAENEMESLVKNKRDDRQLIKLESIAKVTGGKRLPSGTVISENDPDDIPYVRVVDIKDLKVDMHSAVRIPKKVHQLIQNYQLKQNDIVITIVGATIGKVGILDYPVEVCDFTENMARIRINDDSVLTRFLLHYLDSQFGKIQSDRMSGGSSQFKLSLRSCRDLEIYIPFKNGSIDTAEQHNILNKIYVIHEQINSKKVQSDKLINDAKNILVKKIGLPITLDINKNPSFLQAVDNDPYSRLDALFNNPLREKLLKTLQTYPHKLLGKLIKPDDKSEIVLSDFYRLVDLEQIDENTGRISHFREVPELGSEKILIKSGSILISKLQPDKGKVVIVESGFDGCVGSSELMSFSLNTTEVTKEYLWAALRSNYILKQWEYSLTGSSRMRIGRRELNETIIPIPDKNLQDEIVNEIKGNIFASDNLLKELGALRLQAKKEFVTMLTGHQEAVK
ncbi:MAG: restriction endonuclease subunit S [Dehalococcoidales bacterium]|nr:restriction endonuclease subunit S [Dehalococcoidales bacterium]